MRQLSIWIDQKLFLMGIAMGKYSRIINHPLTVLTFRLTILGTIVLVIMAGSGKL